MNIIKLEMEDQCDLELLPNLNTKELLQQLFEEKGNWGFVHSVSEEEFNSLSKLEAVKNNGEIIYEYKCNIENPVICYDVENNKIKIANCSSDNNGVFNIIDKSILYDPNTKEIIDNSFYPKASSHFIEIFTTESSEDILKSYLEDEYQCFNYEVKDNVKQLVPINREEFYNNVVGFDEQRAIAIK